jgi:hypothetical protein
MTETIEISKINKLLDEWEETQVAYHDIGDPEKALALGYAEIQLRELIEK